MEWRLWEVYQAGLDVRRTLLTSGTEKRCRRRLRSRRHQLKPGEQLMLEDPSGTVQELIIVESI